MRRFDSSRVYHSPVIGIATLFIIIMFAAVAVCLIVDWWDNR